MGMLVQETSMTATPTPETTTKAPLEVTVESGKTYWWCACGQSKQQPFCDGSHKGTEFTPLRYKAIETGTKLFCVCKQTANPPFCQGSPEKCGR